MKTSDFRSKYPEPVCPKVRDSGGVWVCDKCQKQFPKNDWCGECINRWRNEHESWRKNIDDEFDTWLVENRDSLSKSEISSSSGVHVSQEGEIVLQRIIDDRLAHARDLIQPFREGVASKEFVEQYPKQARKLMSDEDRAKARYVWDTPAIKKLRRT